MTLNIEDLKPGLADAIDLALSLEEVVRKSNISSNDLSEGFDLALESGHVMVIIALEMVIWGVQISEERKDNHGKV